MSEEKIKKEEEKNKSIIIPVENQQQENKKKILPKNNIFATYNANSPPIETPQVITKTWKNYTPPEVTPFPVSEGLSTPVLYLFDHKLENQISIKPFSDVSKTNKPEFLKNKMPRRSARKLDETNLQIAQSSMLLEYDIVKEYSKKEKKVKLRNKLQSSNKNKIIKNHSHFPRISNSSEFRNPHILEIRGNAIVISKSVLNFELNYEEIIIYKKDIEPFLNNQNFTGEKNLHSVDKPVSEDHETAKGIKSSEHLNGNGTYLSVKNDLFQQDSSLKLEGNIISCHAYNGFLHNEQPSSTTVNLVLENNQHIKN